MELTVIAWVPEPVWNVTAHADVPYVVVDFFISAPQRIVRSHYESLHAYLYVVVRHTPTFTCRVI